MNIDLTNKNALVGGSTQGIGKAIAEELATLGATVTLIARDEQKLQRVQNELPTPANQSHNYLQADFTKPGEVQQQAEELVDEHSVHILVNNTGGPPGGPIIDAEPEEFKRAFSMHLICNQLLTQTVVPVMKEENYGRIINVISTSVKEPIKGLGVSNTTRGAVASWAKTLSIELEHKAITVNNILPGYTKTGRLENIIKKKAKKGNTSEDAVKKQMYGKIPLGRFAKVEELAAVAGFLASPAASYVNGVSLPVDGGRVNSI